MSEHFQAAFPLARSADLAAETLGTETVVYDGLSQEAHYLSPVAATVFAAADGQTSLADMAAIAGRTLGEPVDVATVELALAELEERNLLVVEQDGRSGVSRRQMLRKGALVGGAALTVPLIASVATPAYGATASNPTNLSYVAMTFKCGSSTYRMKIGGDGKVECGSTFNTPGSGDCTLDTGGGTITESCLAGVFITQNINVTPHTVTIHWPTSDGGQTCKLLDYIVKCAGNCQANNPTVPSGGATGGSFTVQGCP